MLNTNYFQCSIFACILLTYSILWFIFISKRKLTTRLLPTTNIKEYRGLSFIYWLSPVLFLAIWGLLSIGESSFLKNIPSPVEVFSSFFNLLVSGELIKEAVISFSRVFVGFSLATIIGVPLGLLAGTFLVANFLIVPLNSFLRYIPPTAFIALLIVYFGVGEAYKYAVIFLGLLFFIIQMVLDVVDDVDMRYIEIGLTSGYTKWDIFTKVIVPFSSPRIFDILRINLSAAWTFLVAAEIIGAESGLGHLIATSQRFLRLGDLYAGILTFGIIGLITDRILQVVSRKFLKWYYVELRR